MSLSVWCHSFWRYIFGASAAPFFFHFFFGAIFRTSFLKSCFIGAGFSSRTYFCAAVLALFVLVLFCLALLLVTSISLLGLSTLFNTSLTWVMVKDLYMKDCHGWISGKISWGTCLFYNFWSNISFFSHSKSGQKSYISYFHTKQPLNKKTVFVFNHLKAHETQNDQLKRPHEIIFRTFCHQ